MNTIKKLNLHKLISVLIITIGILLMIYMITVESEPGAIPLLLIILGTGWLARTWSQQTNLSNNNRDKTDDLTQ